MDTPTTRAGHQNGENGDLRVTIDSVGWRAESRRRDVVQVWLVNAMDVMLVHKSRWVGVRIGVRMEGSGNDLA